MTITAADLALQRTPFGRVLLPGGASAVPAGGTIHSAPGRLGHHACRQYDRRARCIAVTGNGACGTPQLSRRFREAWPGAEPSGRKSRWREPQVERRQASAPASGGRRKPPFSVARPARRLRAGIRQCVCRRSASFYLPEASRKEAFRRPNSFYGSLRNSFVASAPRNDDVDQNSDAEKPRRENGFAFPPP